MHKHDITETRFCKAKHHKSGILQQSGNKFLTSMPNASSEDGETTWTTPEVMKMHIIPIRFPNCSFIMFHTGNTTQTDTYVRTVVWHFCESACEN